MRAQNYSNHSRYYIPHHFIFYPVVLISAGISFYCMEQYPDQQKLWFAVAGLFLLLGVLSYMMRQHYALNNQNRIVRLEVYYRYFASTNKRLELQQPALTFSQLAALRFASEEEFVPLVERTLNENLAADQIKRAIKVWQPDYMRA